MKKAHVHDWRLVVIGDEKRTYVCKECRHIKYDPPLESASFPTPIHSEKGEMRCKEHQLYLMFDHHTANGEACYTCKSGCMEFKALPPGFVTHETMKSNLAARKREQERILKLITEEEQHCRDLLKQDGFDVKLPMGWATRLRKAIKGGAK